MLKPRTLENAPLIASSSARLLEGLDEMELLKLREQIDAKLGVTNLEDIDVSKELVLQFAKLKVLQTMAMSDNEANFSHRSAAATTVSRMLQDIVKCRTALNNAEISKRMDAMVIECMRQAPEDAKAAFFERLERYQATLPTLVTLLPNAGELPELTDEPTEAT